MQAGLLRYIVVNHGFRRAMALLQFLLPPVDKDHLPGNHHFTWRHLHHHLHVGQVLAAGLSASQSRFLYHCFFMPPPNVEWLEP